LKQGTVNLNEDMNLLKLKTHLPLIIRTAHKMIQTIPDSDGVIGGTFGLANKNSTNEDTIVASILNKFIHDDSIRSILKLAAEIMFKINASHLYNNGNKRTSLVSAFAILRYFGYGVNKSPANLLKDWEHIVQNVANYQILDELGAESETIKYIENNIKKIIMVG
jgi:death-on-curing family protein